VTTISRLLKIIVLFRRISSLLWGSFAKETYNFKEPTNRSHPVRVSAPSFAFGKYHCMGWLRSVGSIKLSVSFAEYRLFYGALLQKRPIIFIDPTDRSHPILHRGVDYSFFIHALKL